MALFSWESLLIWFQDQGQASRKVQRSELTQDDIRELQRIRAEITLAREKHRALLAQHTRLMP
jgi:hypothetical protein